MTALRRRLVAAAAVLPLALPARAADRPLEQLPQTPSLDVSSLDRTADPCADFYQYSCGGWIAGNPIPADKARWSVYGKLYQDNLAYLWGLLEEAASPAAGRSAEARQLGDYFAACMDEAAIDARGLAPLADELAAIRELPSLAALPALLARLHRGVAGGGLAFGFGVAQDFGDATAVIAQAYAGGLGLPDRDDYLDDDERSREVRARYLDHVARMLELAGEDAARARAGAHTVMAMETALAAASLTRVERRDPDNVYHRMTPAELQALTPSFRWADYLGAMGIPETAAINVTQPAFQRAFEELLAGKSLEDWRTYLAWHAVDAAAPYLAAPFEEADFDFYRRFLRGVTAMEPRWQRCVALVDRDLGESLGRLFVEESFSPATKEAVEAMVAQVQGVMGERIAGLDWMGEATRREAQAKLAAMRNKIGYPARWRDYGAIRVARDDFFGNVERSATFETRRQLAKISQPVDRDEWGMTPPTVNAYYDPSMNDMNFPAGVLQPPLYDPRSDAAPNYGNTGSTIGHELIHGFDDEGSRFDGAGNLRGWWAAADRAEFDERAACVADQYAGYVVVDDLTINSQLTLGEDLADLGGTVLAYEAWKRATAGQDLADRDGLTPEQRFFVGFAQWACSDERDESRRLNARTNPHSPGRYRVNGVVVNMPEFATAFGCRAGQPMVREEVCRVW
jgi:endothelin-converting enzyme/putative endopeptidase